MLTKDEFSTCATYGWPDDRLREGRARQMMRRRSSTPGLRRHCPRWPVVRGRLRLNPPGSEKPMLDARHALDDSSLARFGAFIRLNLTWTIGFLGLFAGAKGVEGGIRSAKMHQRHVGSDARQAHKILAEAGQHSARVLVRNQKSRTRQVVVAATEANAARYWDGTVAELLAALDPGTSDDWVRIALGEQTRGTGAES
jgi:hypothetical protein